MRWTGVFFCVAAVLLLCGPVLAAEIDPDPVCDVSVRAQFMDDVAAGVSYDELVALYGACAGVSTPIPTKSITITNTGSVSYEELNSCGTHPQHEDVFCDVEIKRYGGYGVFPSGSLEYVLFCFDCNLDGFFDYQTLGSVHVTNDVSGGPLSFYFNASASTQSAPPMCRTADGQNTNVRAILSWVAMPTSCSYVPIWGNQVDFTARRDP